MSLVFASILIQGTYYMLYFGFLKLLRPRHTRQSPENSPAPTVASPCSLGHVSHTAKTSALPAGGGSVYSSFKIGNNRKTEKKNRPIDINKQKIACAFHFHSQ